MSDRVGMITNLCQEWVDEIVQPDGGIVFAMGAKGNPLSEHGIFPHTLSHAELRAACLGLTNILSVPNFQMIGHDDLLFWGWCAQIMDAGYGYFQPTSSADIELRSLFMAMAHALLADQQIVLTYEQDASAFGALSTQARQALALIQDHFTVAAYLCFPLLEGVLRKTLSDFVERDGAVLKSFSVGTRRYDPRGPRTRCNSLADMLYQLEAVECQESTALGDDLRLARRYLERSEPGEHPYGRIGYWRNSSLHGNVSLSAMAGRVFNLVNLVAVHNLIDVQQQPVPYDSLADAARRAALSYSSTVRWSYYPAELVHRFPMN